MSDIEIEYLSDIHGAIIYLNRPERYNAISTQLAQELIGAFNQLEDNPDVWAVGITGRGEKAFCSGADLKERKTMDLNAMKAQRSLFVKMFQSTTFFPKPLVAFVNGLALGGGFELALCCDYIIASENAVFGLTEVSLGIIPAGGGTQNLARLVGKNRAKQLIYTAKRLSAVECKDLGIVDSVCSLAELVQVMKTNIQEITKNAPLALQQAKKSINYGVEIDLHAGFTLEADCYNVLLTTNDRNEGLQAFNEKRPPKYQGN